MKLTGSYSVYMMSNFARTVFYIGVTNDLGRRVMEHKCNEGGVFTSKYKCHYLVYYEKQLKNWQRKWKIELIRKENPDLLDLAKDWE